MITGLLPKPFRTIALSSFSVFLAGCVLAPQGAKHELGALDRSGRPFERAFEDRGLPELPPEPTAQDILKRALLSNGEVEAAYYEWAKAVHRIEQAGGYPNTPLSLNLSYMLSGGGTNVFDRMTMNIGSDPMENLAFPPKVYQAAKVALDDARAAGRRFIGAKLDVQKKILSAWAEYALLTEKIRVQEETVSLLKLISDTAVSRVQAGAPQQDLIRVETEYRLAQDELKTLESRLPQQRAVLNAMMARKPDDPLSPPKEIASERTVTADDSTLLLLASERNPELSSLAEQVKGREDAVELARLQYLPDFNPFVGFTGSVSQLVGLGLSIPTFLPEVRGKVKESRAELKQMMAMYRQEKLDKAAQVVGALYTLRNSERQADLYEGQILPAARRVLNLSRYSYQADTGSFLELLEAERTFLEVRVGLAEAKASREQSLLDLEALIGMNIEATENEQ